MRTPDAFDMDDAAEQGYDEGVTCRHCGAGMLWWLPQRRDTYRLMNADGSFHVCHPPCPPDAFEVMSQ